MQEINRIKKNRGRAMVLLMKALLLTGVFFACTDERFTTNVTEESEGTKCVFTVNLPTQVTTYALTATNENEVKRINVLAFEYKNSRYELADWTAVTGAIEGDGLQKTFSVKFTRLMQGDSYKFVILANAENEVNALLADGEVAIGAEKDALLSQLTMSVTDRWVVNTSDLGYRCIPMWGETSADKTVNENTTINNLDLVRMVARVNVSIDGEGSNPASSVFKLKKVYLYNTYKSGRIVPDRDSLVTNSVSKVKGPTLVAGSTVSKGPILYDKTIEGCDISDIALTNNIYLFETKVPYNEGVLETDKMTTLVVGGLYDTDDETDITYYRIDLVDNGNYINLLRNHSYAVKVTKVSGRGYASADKAFDAKAANIETTVTTIDDGSVSEIKYDGQYMLGVSQSAFAFTCEERTSTSTDNFLTITTDYPKGWDIKITDSEEAGSGNTVTWLETDSVSTSSSGSTSVRLLIPVAATASRTAYIHITAGRLTAVVKVTQSDKSGLSLTVTSDGNDVTELVFTSVIGVKPTPKSFTVDWLPKEVDLTITTTAVGSNIPFPTGVGISNGNVSGAAGTKTFTITPPAVSTSDNGYPFVTKISDITFKVSNGSYSETKTIRLKQINYALEASGFLDKYYMDGSSYSFTVKSNDAWKATITKNGERVLSFPSTLHISNVSGATIRFTIADDVYGSTAGSFGPGTFDITFTSANNLFSPVTHTINCSSLVWAGSNIYWDNEKLTFDDAGVTTHENYQGLFFKWGSLWGISPAGHIMWHQLSPENRVVYKPNAAGTGYIRTLTEAADWETIPSVSKRNISGANEKQPYLTTSIHPDSIREGKGDICKYLTELSPTGTLHGKKWRMPTGYEFGKAVDDNSFTKNNDNFVNITLDDIPITEDAMAGRYENPNFSGYHKKSNKGDVFFPASGSRIEYSGLMYVGYNGTYWSSSPNSTYTSAYCLYFLEDIVVPSESSNRFHAFPVRCVAEQ